MYVEASVQAAPWWGQSVIAVVFLLLGAAIGVVASTVQARGQARQQERTRWDDTILTSSVRMLEIAWTLEHIRNPEREGFISDPTRRARLRTDLNAEFQTHHAKMRLVGSSTLRKATQDLATANTSPEPDWDKVHDAIQEFTSVVRRELGANDQPAS